MKMPPDLEKEYCKSLRKLGLSELQMTRGITLLLSPGRFLTGVAGPLRRADLSSADWLDLPRGTKRRASISCSCSHWDVAIVTAVASKLHRVCAKCMLLRGPPGGSGTLASGSAQARVLRTLGLSRTPSSWHPASDLTQRVSQSPTRIQRII